MFKLPIADNEGSMNPAILLVDFISPSRAELQSFLQSQQCDVDTVSNADSAVSYCQQTQPDLVLLYDSLRDIGSFELCRRLNLILEPTGEPSLPASV